MPKQKRWNITDLQKERIMNLHAKKKSKTVSKMISTALLIIAAAAISAVFIFSLIYRTQLTKLDSGKGVENSIYSEQFKGKKIMVLVPHEDDDLLISGQVLPEIYKKGAMSALYSSPTETNFLLRDKDRMRRVIRSEHSAYRRIS